MFSYSDEMICAFDERPYVRRRGLNEVWSSFHSCPDVLQWNHLKLNLHRLGPLGDVSVDLLLPYQKISNSGPANIQSLQTRPAWNEESLREAISGLAITISDNNSWRKEYNRNRLKTRNHLFPPNKTRFIFFWLANEHVDLICCLLTDEQKMMSLSVSQSVTNWSVNWSLMEMIFIVQPYCHPLGHVTLVLASVWRGSAGAGGRLHINAQKHPWWGKVQWNVVVQQVSAGFSLLIRPGWVRTSTATWPCTPISPPLHPHSPTALPSMLGRLS